MLTTVNDILSYIVHRFADHNTKCLLSKAEYKIDYPLSFSSIIQNLLLIHSDIG